MRVSITLRLIAILLGMAVAVPSDASPAPSAPASGCSDIARDVTVAIQRDTEKTLMIVEDALVINESCATEIIKAAILASNADATLANQIVETGISVSPKMAALITDAANSASPGIVLASTSSSGSYSVPPPSAEMEIALPPTNDSGKSLAKTVMPLATPELDEEFTAVSSSIRGIYLFQPPPSGYPPCNRKCNHVPTSPCGCTP